MSFKTSVLIWFSRFRGIASLQANGVGLLCKTEEHRIQRQNAIKTQFFNDISFEDRVTYEHRGDSGIGFRQKDILFNDIGFEYRVANEHKVIVTELLDRMP